MKTVALLAWLFLTVFSLPIQEQEKPADAAKDDKASQKEAEKFKPKDITEKYKAWHNPAKFAGPPTEFRKGHVAPAKVDPNAIKKLKNGFEIQLPSQAPIPTITYYQGRIYSSGGFHSKQFYCFNADTADLVWAIDLDDDGPSAAVCEDGVCVFNTESCTIFAVDSSNGKMLWSWWLGDPLMSTPTISNGKVFTSYPVMGGGGLGGGQGGFGGGGQGGGGIGGGGAQVQEGDQQTEQPQAVPANQETQQAQQALQAQGRNAVGQGGLPHPNGQTHALACFDLKTGKILWQRWLDSDILSAPIADGGELFVTSFAGTVYKFKEETGEIISATKMRATSAPTIIKGQIVVSQRGDVGNEGAMEAINLMDRNFGGFGGGGAGGGGGAFIPKTLKSKQADYLDTETQAGSELAEQGEELDAGNGFGGGAPASANAGAAFENIGQSSVSTLQAFQGSRSLHAGGYNFVCPGDEIICNDLDGNVKWSIKLKGDLKKVGGMLAAPPIYAGDHVLVSTLSGHVMQIDPEKGDIKKKYKIGSPLRFPPIVHNGKIYVGTQDGKVVCVDTGDKSLTGWTTWGGNSAHNKSE